MSEARDANRDEARRWLRQADEHFASAKWSAKGRHWAAACFQCQQAAELAAKAILIRQGERPRTHGVVSLVDSATQYDPALSELLGAARRLDRFYIPTRYPNGLPTGTAVDHFDELDFQAAETATQGILEVVRQVIENA